MFRSPLHFASICEFREWVSQQPVISAIGWLRVLKLLRLGIAVPAFTSVANYDELRAIYAVGPVAVVADASKRILGFASRQLDESEQVWRAFDELGD